MEFTWNKEESSKGTPIRRDSGIMVGDTRFKAEVLGKKGRKSDLEAIKNSIRKTLRNPSGPLL